MPTLHANKTRRDAHARLRNAAWQADEKIEGTMIAGGHENKRSNNTTLRQPSALGIHRAVSGSDAGRIEAARTVYHIAAMEN